MAGKIDTVEAEAGLDEELGGRTAESAAAERKLNEMAAQSSVDDALAELKKKLGRRSPDPTRHATRSDGNVSAARRTGA